MPQFGLGFLPNLAKIVDESLLDRSVGGSAIVETGLAYFGNPRSHHPASCGERERESESENVGRVMRKLNP